MGTNAQTMVWMMDTYLAFADNMNRGEARGVVTGKTLSAGGSHGREAATGQGIVHCITEWARDRRFNLNGATYTVQGFGNVGSNTARILARTGASLVAVGDWKGYIANREGINPFKLAEYVQRTGSVAGYPGSQTITRDEFFGVEADIFVPAALELEIGPAEAQALRCKVIVEGANGPTDPGPSRSSPTRASTSSPTSSPTPAASASATTSGCRTSAASTGTWKRWRRDWRSG